MKRKLLFSALALVLLVALCAVFSACGDADAEIIYVYNWGEYISDGSDGTLDVNAEFEKYCREVLGRNVKVNYSTFSSNEDMYAKISSGASSYDVIIPSDYMIERMVGEGLLQPLNFSMLPNYKDVDASFKGENVYYEGDGVEGAQYSVPYFYGMIGIIYNTEIVSEEDAARESWELMWDTDYTGDILQFNNNRDAFGTAMYSLGYDVNNATEAQWREALELLKAQKNVVQGYVMDEIFNKMKSGSAAVAAYYAGDFFSMYEDNDALAFYYPSYTNSYVDAMCIPHNAMSVDLAHEYINFMCSERIGIANAEYTCYASPLTTVRSNPDYVANMTDLHEDAMSILYEQVESVTTQAYLNLSPEQLTMLNELWEELKVESSIGVGIYVLCGVIVAALVLLLLWHLLRRRRWSRLYDD